MREFFSRIFRRQSEGCTGAPVAEALSHAMSYEQSHDAEPLKVIFADMTAAEEIASVLYEQVHYRNDRDFSSAAKMDELLTSIAEREPTNSVLLFRCITCAETVQKLGIATAFLSWLESRHGNVMRARHLALQAIGTGNHQMTVRVALAALRECHFWHEAWSSAEIGYLYVGTPRDVETVKKVYAALSKAFDPAKRRIGS